MKITLTDVGKRFNRDWIFRHLDIEFTHENAYAIVGPNGCGKSTLLKVIAGAMVPSEGTLRYDLAGADDCAQGILATKSLAASRVKTPSWQDNTMYRQLSFAAPYLELIEEMTLTEFLNFHHNFKPFISIINTSQIIAEISLESAAHKQIRYFSSGMKQRVKLAQAIFSDSAVLLLDEPCTNLDEEGISLYHELVKNYSLGRLLIVSSNERQEYSFCTQLINILDYKHAVKW